MFNIIPWYYRAAAVLALIVAVADFGYVKGLHHQKEIDDEKFAAIRTVQDEQAIHAGRIALDRDVKIGAIVDTYEAQRRDLDAYYAGRLRSATAANHPGPLSADSLPAGTAARAAYDALAQAYSGLGKDYIGLEGECADTTLQLINLQKAAIAVQTTN